MSKEHTSHISEESLHKLIKIYKKFSSSKNFPSYYCEIVSPEVGHELGYKVMRGFFRLDHPIPDDYDERILRGHSWCAMPDGKIVDLTLAQFNHGLEQKVSKGVVIIDKKSPLYKRYRSVIKRRPIA